MASAFSTGRDGAGNTQSVRKDRLPPRPAILLSSESLSFLFKMSSAIHNFAALMKKLMIAFSLTEKRRILWKINEEDSVPK